MMKQTPSQTVGPFFSIGLYSDNQAYARLFDNELAGADLSGERIRVQGSVYDGAGEPVNDYVLEIWQADPSGRYRTGDRRWNDRFTGFGRVGADNAGRYVLNTLMPGPVRGENGTLQAPHLNVLVFSRGLLLHLFSRIYFDDRMDLNSKDPILALVPKQRQSTLIARRLDDGSAFGVYQFDMHLQGPAETVFFDV